MRSTTSGDVDVVRGEVHGDRQVVGPGAPRARAGRTHRAQREPVSVVDQAGLLGERDEDGRARSAPRVGCRQRISASKPDGAAGAQVDLRLVVHGELGRARRAARAPGAARPAARGGPGEESSSSGEYTATPRRCCLAVYMAMSALRMSDGRVVGVVGQARDADRRVDVQRQLAERERLAEQARAPAARAARRPRRSRTSGSRTANSSPPSRATRSRRGARRAAGRRPARAARRRGRGRGSR